MFPPVRGMTLSLPSPLPLMRPSIDRKSVYNLLAVYSRLLPLQLSCVLVSLLTSFRMLCHQDLLQTSRHSEPPLRLILLSTCSSAPHTAHFHHPCAGPGSKISHNSSVASGNHLPLHSSQPHFFSPTSATPLFFRNDAHLHKHPQCYRRHFLLRLSSLESTSSRHLLAFTSSIWRPCESASTLGVLEQEGCQPDFFSSSTSFVSSISNHKSASSLQERSEAVQPDRIQGISRHAARAAHNFTRRKISLPWEQSQQIDLSYSGPPRIALPYSTLMPEARKLDPSMSRRTALRRQAIWCITLLRSRTLYALVPQAPTAWYHPTR